MRKQLGRFRWSLGPGPNFDEYSIENVFKKGCQGLWGSNEHPNGNWNQYFQNGADMKMKVNFKQFKVNMQQKQVKMT